MKKQKQQSKILIGWTFAWCASTAILSYGVNFLWDSLIITTIGSIINLAIGVGMIIAYKIYLSIMMNYKRKFILKQWPLH